MARNLISMAAIPAGIATTVATGLSPALIIIVAGILVIVAAILFVPSKEPARRLTRLIQAVHEPSPLKQLPVGRQQHTPTSKIVAAVPPQLDSNTTQASARAAHQSPAHPTRHT